MQKPLGEISGGIRLYLTDEIKANGLRFLLVGALVCMALAVCVGCAPGESQQGSTSVSTVSDSSSALESAPSSAESKDPDARSREADAESPEAESDDKSKSESASEDKSKSESASEGKGAASAQPAAFEADPAYDELQAEVEGVLSDAVADVGVAFVDLSDDRRIAGFSVNGDTPLVAASMIKLAILAEFLQEVDSGAIAMEDTYTVQPEDIVGGTGSVQSAGVGATYTYAELARLMICESDNVAANVLIDRMGMDAVNAQAKKLGLARTHLNRKMMDEEAMAQRVENLMSAEDAAVLLSLIYRGQLVSETASTFAFEALEAQADSAGIAAGLPEGVVFAHKTGTLPLVKNDGGIVEAPKPYVLVVFFSGAEDSTAFDLMARISSLVYETVE